MITLVIIGVIAAITVPTLITKYQKEQTVTRLKKAYTTISNAMQLSQSNSGIKTSEWVFDTDGVTFFNSYLKPYLSTAVTSSYDEYQEKVQITYLNNNRATGQNWTLENPSRANYNAVLSDGTVMIIEGCCEGRTNRKLVAFDLNGVKKPNRLGKDIFIFKMLATENRIVPNSYDLETRTYNTSDCVPNSYGTSCSAKIMQDSWQIKDDYPW